MALTGKQSLFERANERKTLMKCPQRWTILNAFVTAWRVPDRRRHLDEDFWLALTFRDADLSRTESSNPDAGRQPNFSAQLQMV